MEGLPRALIITSRDEVIANNNVLYRLVQPLEDRSGVKSTDRLVNVVPYRRIYNFSSKREIEEFSDMLLKRPLVLQPILHFGRGMGHACGACYNQEPWIVMVNQTHPKILSRLQMGLESARQGIERGQAVEIKFRFGKVIERVYREHLTQKELKEAEQAGNSVAHCMTYFRYAEWEHADLIIRHHGLPSRAERKAHQLTPEGKPIKGKTIKWDFEDVTSDEILWTNSDVRVYNKPHLAPVKEEEIREVLPEWTINSVSPLEYIGDSIPQHSYSYAQAGRLYESFRKKKRQRPTTLESLPVLGATGDVDPSPVSPEDVAVEHDFSKHSSEDDRYPSRARQYYNEPSPVGLHYNEQYDDDYYHSQGYAGSRDETVHANDFDYYNDNSPSHVHQYGYKQSDDFRSSQPYRNSPARVQAEVEITPTASHSENHGASNQRGENFNRSRPQDDSPFVRKQDSDSSSHSTNADSGYCPEGDGRRSRGDSYDNSYPSVPAKSKGLLHHGKGRENLAFHHEEDSADMALQRHKELVAKMLQEQSGPGYSPDHPRSPYISKQAQYPPVSVYNGDVRVAPPRQKRQATSTSSTELVAESFI